ncbi:hypothetical protein OSTOST_26164 [Ostertagia ostertagi]
MPSPSTYTALLTIFLLGHWRNEVVVLVHSTVTTICPVRSELAERIHTTSTKNVEEDERLSEDGSHMSTVLEAGWNAEEVVGRLMGGGDLASTTADSTTTPTTRDRQAFGNSSKIVMQSDLIASLLYTHSTALHSMEL